MQTQSVSWLSRLLRHILRLGSAYRLQQSSNGVGRQNAGILCRHTTSILLLATTTITTTITTTSRHTIVWYIYVDPWGFACHRCAVIRATLFFDKFHCIAFSSTYHKTSSPCTAETNLDTLVSGRLWFTCLLSAKNIFASLLVFRSNCDFCLP